MVPSRLTLRATALLCCVGAPGLTQESPSAEQLLRDLACSGCHDGIPPDSSIRDKAPDLTYAGLRYRPHFVRREGVWFCNTNTRTDQGWIPITPDMFLAECGDWPPVRILGTDTRYANCQECHVAQIALAFDSRANRYATRLTSLAIDCEACHGPLAEHVRRSDPSRIAAFEDLAVEALATRSKDGSLEVCFRCHAVKDVLLSGYLPGESLENYYSLGFPSLGESPLFFDGRVRTFAYQENHRYSDCYLNGSMTCVDCHDPHAQGYRDIRGRVLDGRFSDGQCTACHASKAERPEAHSHHRPGSPGGKCADCHMPYVQHPEIGYRIRFARSDHTIPIPRPGSDDRMGVVNACAQAQCHPGAAPAALEAPMRQWYGDLKPRPPIVETLLRVDSLRDAASAVALLDTTVAHPASQVAALGQFAARFLWPDMPSLDAAVDRALRGLTRNVDLDLRAAALAALHLARGEDPATREYLIRALKEPGDVDGALRARWATALGTFADQYQEAGQWDRAVNAYRKALELRPGNPTILRNLGVAYASAGNHRSAVQVLRQSIAADARQALAWINLGVSLQNLGDTLGAEDAYRRATAVNADEPLAHFNLGNLLLRRRQLRAAIGEYERALTLQPTLTPAYEYLMLASLADGDAGRALAAARRWRRFAPNDPRLRDLIAELETVSPPR